MTKLTAIVINYNTTKLTTRSIKSFLQAANNFQSEVILIDNASNEPITWSSDNSVKLIHNKTNLGFAKACNQGLSLAQGDYVLLLNSDVIITKEALEQMLALAAKENDIGIIGPAFYFPNHKFQTSCGRFPNLWRELSRFFMIGKIISTGTLIYQTWFNKKFFETPQIVDWVSGGCMLIKQSLIKQIGLLDDNFFFGVEDFDYCRRAQQAGFKVIYLPSAKIIHYHSFSSGGHRSTLALHLESQGMKYFLNKYQANGFFKLIDSFLYKVKIIVLDLLMTKK